MVPVAALLGRAGQAFGIAYSVSTCIKFYSYFSTDSSEFILHSETMTFLWAQEDLGLHRCFSSSVVLIKRS